ncbi:hypothetical protein PO909_004614 [Leuciscus waleckii]
MFENGLETESEETVCEKKEISKEEDRSVEDDPLYFSDPENIISKDGDHLKNGEMGGSLKVEQQDSDGQEERVQPSPLTAEEWDGPTAVDIKVPLIEPPKAFSHWERERGGEHLKKRARRVNRFSPKHAQEEVETLCFPFKGLDGEDKRERERGKKSKTRDNVPEKYQSGFFFSLVTQAKDGPSPNPAALSDKLK